MDAQDQVRTLAPQLSSAAHDAGSSVGSVRPLREHTFVPRRIRFNERQLREAVASSRSCAEVLRKVGLRAAGGNHLTFKKYVALWGISTEHFDQGAVRRESLSRAPIPLSEILVEHSTYHRGHLSDACSLTA